jgi:hypothetical protein
MVKRSLKMNSWFSSHGAYTTDPLKKFPYEAFVTLSASDPSVNLIVFPS